MTNITKSGLAKKITLGLAAAAISVTALASTAQAKKPFSFYIDPHYGVGISFGHGYHHGHYGGIPWKCKWLKKKYKKTGKHFWWKKYKKCLWKHYH